MSTTKRSPNKRAEPARLRPIGTIRSTLTTRIGAPKQGSDGAPDAWLEVSKFAAPALDGLVAGGDMIVINNYAVMHARTRFTNFPEPERQRRLVRLWFDAEGFRDVPREFNLFAENGIPKQEGRRATFDFKKLYRDDPVATGGVPDLKISDGEAARR